MGDRDQCGRRSRDRGADTGDHLHGHTGLHTAVQLFATAPEHEPVTTLEPHHDLAGLCARDQGRVDLALFGATSAGNLGDIDYLGVRCQLTQHPDGREAVGDDHIGAHDGVAAGHGEQSGSPGPPPTKMTRPPVR